MTFNTILNAIAIQLSNELQMGFETSITFKVTTKVTYI